MYGHLKNVFNSFCSNLSQWPETRSKADYIYIYDSDGLNKTCPNALFGLKTVVARGVAKGFLKIVACTMVRKRLYIDKNNGPF